MQTNSPSAHSHKTGWPAVWGCRQPISSREMYQTPFGCNGRVMEQEKLKLQCQRAFTSMCFMSVGLCMVIRSTLSNRGSCKVRGCLCLPWGPRCFWLSAALGSLVLFWLLAAMEITPICPGRWITCLNI